MQIIMLSGGSGSRLWPLSNDARSKQFLKLLPVSGSEERESMVQRVVRQIRESGICADLTVATSLIQRDAIESQLGKDIAVVTEPERRRTLPAICLATEYLSKVKGCPDDEVTVRAPLRPLYRPGLFRGHRKDGGVCREGYGATGADGNSSDLSFGQVWIRAA